MTDYNKQVKEYINHYKNDWFLFWFERRYGKRQTRKLKALVAKKNQSPHDCVNFRTQIDYDQAEHNGNFWHRRSFRNRRSWR